MQNKNPKSNKLLSSFKEPWKIINKKPMSFFIYCLFTIFAGQIGIIINIISRVLSGNNTISESLYLDSINGSFYTFSIALIASVLGPLFVNFVENSPTEFRSIKISTICITIFLLFFAGIFYSVTTINQSTDVVIKNIGIDIPQLIFFIISIVVALYTFNILELDEFKDEFKGINDNYAQLEDQGIKNLEKEVIKISNDSKGNRV